MSEKYPIQQRLLHSAFSQNKLSHAYLLSGAILDEKLNFARGFAQFLHCEKKIDSKSCGTCKSCQWMIAATHPDFFLITPPEKKHSIKIDQIRELSDQLSRTAQQGGYQVVVISPANAMPTQAANALLKTLEEPSGNVVLFLIDDQKNTLPATIVSRCQKIILPSRTDDLRLYNQALTLRDQLLQHLQNIGQRRVNPITLNATWLKIPLDDVLQHMIVLCHDLMLVQHDVKPSHLIHHDVVSILSVVAQTITPEKLQQFTQLCFEKKAMCTTGVNLNAQLCLEYLFIEWELLVLSLNRQGQLSHPGVFSF